MVSSTSQIDLHGDVSDESLSDFNEDEISDDGDELETVCTYVYTHIHDKQSYPLKL